MTAVPSNPHPLWRRNAIAETAKDAARAMRPKALSLRQRVLDRIERGACIPETILANIRADGVQTVLTSIRPRCSELARMGLITDSGAREKGEGGCKAIVWRATTELERAAWARQQEGASHDPDEVWSRAGLR